MSKRNSQVAIPEVANAMDVIAADPAAMEAVQQAVAETVAAAKPEAEVVLVRLSKEGAVNPFREGSQRAIWFANLQKYEGKPLAEWLKDVAANPPKQRVKENHKSPHKGGMGFLRRFHLQGLLAEGVYKGE